MQVRVQGASHKCERGRAQVPVLGKYPLVGDRLWVGARVSKYPSTPSKDVRRVSAYGGGGRGEGGGGPHEEGKEKNGRGWSSESGGVKPMSRRGQGLD